MPRTSLLALLLPVLLAGADWPRFRGPHGDGQAGDKTIPVRWSAENQLWKVAVPGIGHSSPIVVKGRIFLQSEVEDQRVLLCYDASKGKLLWQRTAPGKSTPIHGRNTRASSTPCSDDERVYTTFWDGKMVTLAAYDLAGKHLWSQPLGTYQHTGKENRHGAAFSPIAYGGKVFVNFDRTGAAAVLAYDARTGKKVWEQPRPAFRTCYSTPFIREQGGQKQLVVASTAGISGYNPDSGKEIWKYTWKFGGMALRTVGSPVEDNGLVFAVSGDGSGERGMIAVRLGGTGELGKSALAWQKDRGNPYVPTPLATGGFVYFAHDDGTAACFDGKTGAEVWRERLSSAQVSASPVLVSGKVYAPDMKGVVHVFAATPKGYQALAHNNLGEPIFATPAVANGRIYVRGRKHLFCIGAARTSDGKR